MTGESNRFLRNTLLKASIAGEGNHVMVKDGMISCVITGCRALSREGIPHRIPHTLAQRSSRSLDTFSLVKLWVTRSDRVKLAEIGNVLARHLEASEMKPAINKHRSMTSREDETVAVQPLWSSGVKTEAFTKKDSA